MARLQQRADEATPSLRARRRARRHATAVRRSIRVALVMVVMVAIALVALDAWDVRSSLVDVVQRDVINPSRAG
jgi:hypothetical protein